MLRGGKVDVFDPGTHGEWGQAFRNVTNTTVIDLADSRFSLDPLRMFEFEEAGAVAADHILPMIGVPADSDMENRFTLLVSPQMRESAGIRSMRSLIAYLRAQPDANSDMLLARLEAWATQPAARAIFDGNTSAVLTDAVAGDSVADQPSRAARRRRHSQPAPLRQVAQGRSRGHGDLRADHRHRAASSVPAPRTVLHDDLRGGRRADGLSRPVRAPRTRITRQGRKHATGIWLISQDYRDFARMGDKFITQKWLFAIRNEGLATKTLEWAGVDPALYPEVVQSYYEDTSPAESADDEDSDDDAFGKVHPSRMGEGFIVDERGRRARCRFLGAPNARLVADVDSTPPQEVFA